MKNYKSIAAILGGYELSHVSISITMKSFTPLKQLTKLFT